MLFVDANSSNVLWCINVEVCFLVTILSKLINSGADCTHKTDLASLEEYKLRKYEKCFNLCKHNTDKQAERMKCDLRILH